MEVNPGKKLEVDVDGHVFWRIPVRTKVIEAGDDLLQVIREYAGSSLQKGDLLVISEKVVAITQGRAFFLEEIKPSRLAVFLAKFVHKSPYGIGLGSPHSMELALLEVGRVKIVLAAIIAALGKLVGIKGLFYRLCGEKAQAIDGPCDYTLPPYDNCVILAPENPNQVAKNISAALGLRVAVIDANDLGVNILGKSHPDIDCGLLEEILRDNPLGQSRQQTPLGIIRAADRGLAQAAASETDQ